ncbi:uncharacterized protein LOC18096055 isoform X10 [Populus trichocarpa]|uniref:uncharacterized protein LOC18096055 isoform X10 n=1 Tax=Populus trichocarpa TaxID=3694 RepID=UPI0022799F05|nr:uncharacterized protein LOC18096055 isoform X10 [Populus trichocarpa]
MALESAGGSIIAMLAELMVEPVGRLFRYMFCFNNFVEEFKERKENLALALDGLQKDVEAAERNAKEIKKGVKKWLEDANNEIEGAKPLENEIGKNGKCFTWCPNCMRQFKLSKALAKKSETFRKLLETKFTKVAHKAPPQHIEFLQSKDFTPSESSKEALEQIMKALKDDNANMIGLYGMGGVGKTTLVKEVGRRAKELQLVDQVLIATVSQTPNVTGIQDRMADSLDLNFDKKSKEGRANELWQRLQGKKMLIILDDVWKHIDLKDIGIPFGDDHRGCKILLTTRLQGICSSMECQQKVLLRVLPEDEAWDLFRINAGLRDGDSTLNTVAREVARECQGLPIALVTVGRALRGKSRVQWEVASRQLKESQFVRMEQIDEQNNAYTCLKLSYDYLKYEETKSCFVVCCLFPEDYDIPIEDLTRYAVGYGLHQDTEPIEDARKRVSVAIENLKDCCMLLGTETEERVKMHDLVRDFAIQIASSEEYGFEVKAGIGLEKWPMGNKSFEGCTTISLMGNKLAELPEGLVCPRLKVLLLGLDDGMNVPETFFEGMKEIEVLSLKGGCLSMQSLKLSTKLQSLVLISCNCKDLIRLRKLQRLKILGLMSCLSIEELPDEIGELKELRLLDVRGCRRLRRIPVNLIGRLKKLEELLIGDRSFQGWDAVGCDSTGGMNASLTELNSLSQLAVLSLWIPKVECIPRDFVFPVSLRKYDIIFGNRFDAGRYPTSTRLILAGTSFNAKTFEQLFLHKLEFVKVRDCEDVFTLFPAKLRQGLKNLKEVIVDSCKSLEEVFELGEPDEGSSEEKELPLLSSLTELRLSCLPELKCIWKGPSRHVSLQSLNRLNLESLNKLTFIFTPSLARSLPKLQRLYIIKCGQLKHIIREEDGEREIIPESPEQDGQASPINVEKEIVLPNLKELSLEQLSSIVCFSFGWCDYFLFPRLEKLKVHQCPKLTTKFATTPDGSMSAQSEISQVAEDSSSNREWTRDYGWKEGGNLLAQLQMAAHGHGQQNSFLQRLEFVQVRDCGDVRTSFPAKLLQALKNLKSVEIEDCKSLEEVFELGEADEGISEEKELPLLSSLTELQLRGLPELKCIWKEPTRHVSLQSLTLLNLYSLNKLTFIFTLSLAQSLPKLERLEISDCGELKYLIREEDGEREIIPESPSFPELKTIIVYDCGKLEYVFPVSVCPSLLSLEVMWIFYSDNLKQIFYNGEGDTLTTYRIIEFPRLRKLALYSTSNYSFFGSKNIPAHLPSLQNLCLSGHEELGNLSTQLQQNGFLQRLEFVRVDDCGDVRPPFPAKLLRALKNLKEVIVDSCKSLEEVFELGEADEGSSEEKEMPLLSSLTELKLKILPELKCIWKGPTRHVNLQSLINLELYALDKLTFIFTPSLAYSLPKLQRLYISDCGELKHIIREEDGEREIIPESPCFPQLKNIYIYFCDKLEYVFPVSLSHNRDGIIKFPQLRELSLGLRSNYSFLGPRNFDAQLPLQYLAIQGHEEVGNWLAQLQMAVHGQQNGFLQRLEFVRVDDCGDVRPPFPAKLLRALKNLKSVEIEDCKSLEEVFELGEPDEGSSEEKELLSSLTMLDLQRLPEVKCIWKGPTRYVSLQSLNILKLRSLDKLTFIFTPSLARSLPKLAGLYINNCAELQHIIREEAGEREIIQESPGFPELKTIIIEECGKLEYVFPVSVSPSLLNLEEMRIFKAHNLKQIFYSVEGDALTTDGIIKFPKLRKLSISNCSFFGPKNFAAQLPSLQYLKIDGHKELGNLSAQIQGLTNLKTLRLKSLPDMSCIWKGLVLSKLTTLEMAVHGQQNDFLQRLKYVEVDDCGDVRAPFPAKLLRALKILSSVQIEDCKSLEEVFELGEPYEGSSEEKELPLPSSLTWLRLYQLPELKCIWKGPTSHVSLQSLAYLYLNSLDKLTFIFTPSLVQSLPQLESLHINKCGELKHIIREEDGEREIIPEPPCFPKLKTISIKECGKLEYVFPVSVSPSLLNLEEMQIFEAHNLKQIFYSGEGDALTRDAIIKFPKLRRLSLSNCSFFATKNFAAQLPSLQILEIDGHKELGNLFAQLQGFTNLKELRLHHLPDTRCVWKGLSKLTTLKQNGFLQRLKFVRVDDCGDVRTPFPAKLLRALNNLKKVIVDSCKSLEEVFELGEPDEGSSEEKELPLLSSLTELRLSCLPELKCIWKGPSRHVSLQSLNRLNLESLNKLTFIFTPSLARSLPKLERLYISKCGQLKHIIREENGEKEIIPESPGQDDQASPINVEKEIVLPNLKELSLEQLSSIVCFSFGWCDYFLFPRLEKLKVHQCPRLTTKFATTPDGSMSAQSEVSEVAEYSSFKREWTRNNGWKEVEEEEEEEEDDDDVGSEEEEEEEEEEEDDDDDC